MEQNNEVLRKLISLKKEWDECESRIEAIKKELRPVIIERYKQLNYKEKEQEFRKKIAPRKYGTGTRTIGTVNWMEDFKGEGTNEVITIERCAVVRVDDEWILNSFSLNKLINF
ncbi:hypothetical protein [uncultured Bacteroides sp.]|uniref:hypothetical protein n=1 Tax=uncultured Bacteroides sp. TaxID=162156 RepID=UPI002AAB1583|nr:hypothetical protein [uncultured Bacteroides sp.]